MFIVYSKFSAGPFGGIYGDTSIAECGLTLRKSIDARVNYIDTAPWYGQGQSVGFVNQISGETCGRDYFEIFQILNHETNRD